MGHTGSSQDRQARCRTHPSPVAVDRLRTALRAELSAYAEDLDLQLHPDPGGSRDSRAGTAPSAPTDRLEAFQRRIQRLVAGAVAEREAEAVLAAVSSPVADGPADAAGPDLNATAARPAARRPARRPARGPARRHARRARRLAVGAVVGMLLAMVTGQRLAGG